MTNTPNLGLTQYAGTDTIDFLTQYNADIDKIDDYVGANNTNIGTLSNLKTAIKTSAVGAINEVYDTTDNGWISTRATLTYSSASAPTFVCNTSIDLTTRISVGMKIKLTHGGATKYFFITAISATSITLYGGTDYTLTNSEITNVYYSVVKAPYGFPLNPNKWSVIFKNATDISTGLIASANTIINFPGISLSIPIGLFDLSVQCFGVSIRTGTYNLQYIGLSTTNNTFSDSDLVAGGNYIDASTGEQGSSFNINKKGINLTSKTTYYLNTRSSSGGAILDLRGTKTTTIITATCAYL